MHLLPERNQFYEVFSSGSQNSPDRAAFRVRRSNRIHAVGQPDSYVVGELDDNFRLLKEPVNVPWGVVLRICDEEHTAKATRRHSITITQAA
jgi:hypothetical protein